MAIGYSQIDIEFFKWSFKEEGYTYKPLKKMEVSYLDAAPSKVV